MEILTRKQNENDFEYCLRVCLAKRNKEIDIDWSEIVDEFEFLGGVHCDTLRKNFVGNMGVGEVVKHYEEKLLKVANGESENQFEEQMLELELKRQELKKERVKIQTLRSDLNKSIREESRKELFYEQLRDDNRNNSLEPVKFQSFTKENGNKDHVLCFSDIHYGAEFSVGINSYSTDICEGRFAKLLHETIELIEKESIETLKVVNLSDSIQGVLRVSDLIMNSISVTEQIKGVSRLLASFLNELSGYVNVEYYHILQANHSELRFLGTKSGELREDVELMIRDWVSDLLSNNDRVKVIEQESDKITEINLAGYTIALVHGQDIKNYESFIRDLSMVNRKIYDGAVMGHIHHHKEVCVGMNSDGSDIMVVAVPSVVGSCEYSKKLLKTSGAGALLMCYERGKGKVYTRKITV